MTKMTRNPGRMSSKAERVAWTSFITGESSPKPSKYGNERTGNYASKKEADVATSLQALARGGKIRNLQEQVPICLVPGDGEVRGVTYVADFCYDDAEGHHVIDAKPQKLDAKGRPVRPAAYKIKKRLAWLLHGIRIEEI